MNYLWILMHLMSLSVCCGSSHGKCLSFLVILFFHLPLVFMCTCNKSNCIIIHYITSEFFKAFLDCKVQLVISYWKLWLFRGYLSDNFFCLVVGEIRGNVNVIFLCWEGTNSARYVICVLFCRGSHPILCSLFGSVFGLRCLNGPSDLIISYFFLIFIRL